MRHCWRRRMTFACAAGRVMAGGHGAAAQVRGADWYGLAAGPGRLGDDDGNRRRPPTVGVQAEAEGLTHDSLVALVGNADYQRLALLYVAARLGLADALRGGPKQSRVLA